MTEHIDLVLEELSEEEERDTKIGRMIKLLAKSILKGDVE